MSGSSHKSSHKGRHNSSHKGRHESSHERSHESSHQRSHKRHTIGVVSDTHGLLRPQVTGAFAGCEAIIHAGDIGKPDVLAKLAELAPVTAIRGNVDHWASELPDRAEVSIAGRKLYVLHDVKTLELDPAAAGFDVVIAGHSHRPRVETIDGVLFVNPGSAGPRRFRLPITVATLTIGVDSLQANIVELPL